VSAHYQYILRRFVVFSGASPSGRASSPTAAAFPIPMRRWGCSCVCAGTRADFAKHLRFRAGTTYTLAYSAAQRSLGNGGESWNVLISGAVIHPTVPVHKLCRLLGYFVATSTSQTLAFLGTDLATAINCFHWTTSASRPPLNLGPPNGNTNHADKRRTLIGLRSSLWRRMRCQRQHHQQRAVLLRLDQFDRAGEQWRLIVMAG